RNEEKVSGSSSWYSYSQYHWTPVALIVIAGSSSGVYCAVSNWNEGTAIKISAMTGPSVQITSITVLWLVRDGVLLTLSRYLTRHQPNRTRTRSVVGTMNASVYCSNQAISSMIRVAGSWKLNCQGAGCPA